MLQNLFVYGTLMRAAAECRLGRSERARLEAAGEWLGLARINGCLYDLGAYPVVVAPPAEVATLANDTTVHGEVFRLRAPAMTFRWLDIYEGISPGKTTGTEYTRAIAKVHLDDGDQIEAWLYRNIGPIGRARHIPNGRWRPQEDAPKKV